MKKIYPKIDASFQGLHKLKKYIEKYRGVEIQILEEENGFFSMEEEIRTLMDLCPNTEEITIHTPLDHYDLEMILLKDKNIVLEQLEVIKSLSMEYSIHINLLYHTSWTFKEHQKYTIPYLQEILFSMKGFPVTFLLENVYTNLEKECTVLKLCKFIGDPQLRVCLDLCHIYCLAHIFKEPIEVFMEKYLKKKDLQKYVKQIHFASTREEDGYKDHDRTHSTKHDTIGEMVKDVELLYSYGLYDGSFVTEIREEDFRSREDQVWEIETLEDIDKMINTKD